MGFFSLNFGIPKWYKFPKHQTYQDLKQTLVLHTGIEGRRAFKTTFSAPVRIQIINEIAAIIDSPVQSRPTRYVSPTDGQMVFIGVMTSYPACMTTIRFNPHRFPKKGRVFRTHEVTIYSRVMYCNVFYAMAIP